MKTIAIIFLALLSPYLLTSSADIDIARRIEKKINKLYHTESFELIKMDHIPSGFHDSNSGVYSFYKIMDKHHRPIGYVAHGMTHVCYFGGCTIYTDQSKNVNREEVKYLVYFDDNRLIKYIEIIDFESNYGYEISAKWWLKQFYNQRPGTYAIGDNIDGISGATVSCEQFVMTVNDLIEE